jgi:hypothetical protein
LDCGDGVSVDTAVAVVDVVAELEVERVSGTMKKSSMEPEASSCCRDDVRRRSCLKTIPAAA